MVAVAHAHYSSFASMCVIVPVIVAVFGYLLWPLRKDH